jgi:hypothetical protein
VKPKSSTLFNLGSSFLRKRIEKKYGKIVFEFPVLHHQWESDSLGFVVETEEGKQIILTNHQKEYLSSAQELENKIAEYQQIIHQTQKALCLMNYLKK